VTDDGGVVTRSSGERTTVTSLLLDVANDGSLGALTDGENVSDVQGSLLSAVNERSGRETLGSDESLLSDLVSVRVSEDDSGQGGTSDGKQQVARSVKADRKSPRRRGDRNCRRRAGGVDSSGNRQQPAMSISKLCQIPSIPICTASILDLIPTILSHIPSSSFPSQHSPTSVVDDVLDNSSNVSVLLGKVKGPELGRVLPVVGVGLEDPAGFTLVPNDSL
jgi:hypothetical protein